MIIVKKNGVSNEYAIEELACALDCAVSILKGYPLFEKETVISMAEYAMSLVGEVK